MYIISLFLIFIDLFLFIFIYFIYITIFYFLINFFFFLRWNVKNFFYTFAINFFFCSFMIPNCCCCCCFIIPFFCARIVDWSWFCNIACFCCWKAIFWLFCWNWRFCAILFGDRVFFIININYNIKVIFILI